MPSFLTSEMEKANVKFIELVKKYPCIWNRDASDYNQKHEMDKAWNEIANEIGDTPKVCLMHWQKLRRAYARSFRLNANGSCQKSEYYMASALEFVRPHLKLGCTLVGSDKKVTNDTDDSHTSMLEIEIKDEPYDDDEDTASVENAEKILFDIIKMEEEDSAGEKNNSYKSEKSKSFCEKRESEYDSNETNKIKEIKEEEKDVHPSSCLIDANRKFFESLIPFVDDMNTQQNRRFRREIMCLIDDVLDDRDIDG